MIADAGTTNWSPFAVSLLKANAMKVKSVTHKFALFLSALLIGGSGTHLCGAQSLHGLKVGEPSATLGPLGAPSDSDTYKGMAVQRWDRPNGNSLSVTIGKNGVVFIESDWNGSDDAPGCDLPGLRFEKTTLAELRKRFGSNGFGYKARGYSAETPDGIVMMNSYEVGVVVVTFYTKINRDEFSSLKASGKNPWPADYAKLDAISIAEDNYATSEWGERVYDPAYKKIEWKWMVSLFDACVVCKHRSS